VPPCVIDVSVTRSRSDNYDEKYPKSWRGTRLVQLALRALEIFHKHVDGKPADAHLFTNRCDEQLRAGMYASSPSASATLYAYAASTWRRLGTPVHEVAEYLGDDPRTDLKICAHVLGEGQRRDCCASTKCR